MKRLLIGVAALVVVGVAVGLATTLGGGASDDNSSHGTAASNGDTTVSVRQIANAGRVLVDSSGHALYASDQESNGMVLCTGACNSFWTPLTIGNGAPTANSIDGTLGVVKRPDGARQVTYKGKLLYSFYLDPVGKVTGDGFEDAFGGRQLTWHVVHGDNTSSSTANGPKGDRGSPGY